MNIYNGTYDVECGYLSTEIEDLIEKDMELNKKNKQGFIKLLTDNEDIMCTKEPIDFCCLQGLTDVQQAIKEADNYIISTIKEDINDETRDYNIPYAIVTLKPETTIKPINSYAFGSDSSNTEEDNEISGIIYVAYGSYTSRGTAGYVHSATSSYVTGDESTYVVKHNVSNPYR